MDGNELRRVPLRANPTGQGLILVTTALLALGVVMAFSTMGARTPAARWYYRLHLRQLLYACAGFLVLCTLWRIDYRWLARRRLQRGRALKWLASPAGVLLAAAVAASVVVLVINPRFRGSARWLTLGPIGFQPSEVLKFALLVYLAALLTWLGDRVRSFRAGFLPAALLSAGACGLIISQDFGTAAIVGVAALVMLLLAGARWWHFLLAAPVAGAGLYAFVYRVPHRWRRIAVMFMPFSTTHPAAFQSQQSLIAIGSGIEPAGLGGGAAKFGYLPEAQPDFIFSVICQEAGPAGAALVFLLLLAWLALAWRIAVRAPDRFGALLAGGLGAAIALQAALHIAVTVWAMPPTGVSLCFVSYGGTALLGMCAATAMIVSVSARRPVEPGGAALEPLLPE